MFLKRILPIGIILLAVCFAAWQHNKSDCLGEVQSTLQQDWTGQNSFSIKAERRPDECGGFLPDSFYVFQIKNEQSQEWREIMVYRHDDPINLKDKFIRIINENVAYVFMFDRFAVTTDGGKTLKTWDAKKDLIDMMHVEAKYPNWAEIEEINIGENGIGKMQLKRIDRKIDLIRELRTDDFGKTWIPQK